jgi:hypothetical protein
MRFVVWLCVKNTRLKKKGWESYFHFCFWFLQVLSLHVCFSMARKKKCFFFSMSKRKRDVATTNLFVGHVNLPADVLVLCMEFSEDYKCDYCNTLHLAGLPCFKHPSFERFVWTKRHATI